MGTNLQRILLYTHVTLRTARGLISTIYIVEVWGQFNLTHNLFEGLAYIHELFGIIFLALLAIYLLWPAQYNCRPATCIVRVLCSAR